MPKRFFKDHIVLLSLAALAVCLVVVRACRQSITIDEADSFLLFVRHPWPLQLYPSSGNHVLNTILAWLTTSAFGISEWTIRAPAIAGAILYIGSAVWFCRLLSTRTLLQVPLFLCLVYNPMILDYLVAARGYSLAMGFLMAAIAVATSAILADSQGEPAGLLGKCVLVSVFLALSFAANFSFTYVDAALSVLLFSWAASRSSQAIPHRYTRLAAACFLPGLAVAGLICGSTVLGYPRSQLYFGSQSLAEMWNGLISASFDNLDSQILTPSLIRSLNGIRQVLPYLGVVTMLALVVAAEMSRRRSTDSPARRLLTLTRLLAVTALIALLTHWTVFRVLHIPLPQDRTALFFVLLWTLAFGAALAVRFQSPARDVARSCGIGVLIAVAAFFAGCLRFSYFKEWKWNADTRQVYWAADDVRRRCGVTSFGTDWKYTGALNVYRAAYAHDSYAAFTSSIEELPTDRDAYIVYYPDSVEFINKQRLTVVYHNELSGAAVAVRGCKSDQRSN
jgi:predicted Na+-dependent transporter